MNQTNGEAKGTFDEIWTFIEGKLKTPVPAYIKYILQYCGYNNGISMATIDDNDIEYFVGEVKNGNISNYFKPIIGEKSVLEGSMKDAKNFEFSRGHIKFLKSIVSFLKKCIEENGPDCFTMEKPTMGSKIKKLEGKMPSAPRKKMKYSAVTIKGENLEPRHEPHKHRPSNTNDMENPIQKQNRILVSKMLMSLKTHTKVLYAENANIINNKISTQLVIVKEIEFEDKSEDKSSESENLEESSEKVVWKAVRKYTAKLYCPYCAKSINVFYVTSGSPRWNSSNFDRHLISNHVQSNDKKTLDKEAHREAHDKEATSEARGNETPSEARDNETPRETRDKNIRVEEIRNDETRHNEIDVINVNYNGTMIVENENYPEPSEKSLKGDQRNEYTYRQELDRYVRQGNECGTDENGFDKSSQKSRNIGPVSHRDKEAPREARDNETPSETRNDEIRHDEIRNDETRNNEIDVIDIYDNGTTIVENENYPERSEKSWKGDQRSQCTYRQELDSYIRKGKECGTGENEFHKSSEKPRNIGLVSYPDSDDESEIFDVDEGELRQQVLSVLTGENANNLKLEQDKKFSKSVSKVNETEQKSEFSILSKQRNIAFPSSISKASKHTNCEVNQPNTSSQSTDRRIEPKQQCQKSWNGYF